MSGLIKSSIARKVAMALSAFFLLIFLLLHFSVNFISLFSERAFNEASHFMGTNPLIQFLMQPILLVGVVFHFVMGFVLEAKNKAARPVKYTSYAGGENASWMSRNMLISGVVILAFLGLHFYDFWMHEITVKYVNGDTTGLLEGAIEGSNQYRYYAELHEKFRDPIRVAAYCVSFVLLSLHLLHGFQSAFQSIGMRKFRSTIVSLGKIYAIAIPAGFIIIALYHHFTHLN